MLRSGYWITQCPACLRYARVGDGPEGHLAGHAMNVWEPWTGMPFIPCVIKDMNITDARALVNQVYGLAPIGQEE